METAMMAVAVTDSSQVAEARRRVAAFATRNGLMEKDLARAALVVTELGTNLIKHGGGGQIVADLTARGLGLLALDRGQGMANPRACLADGYSTAGTLGHGLGAVQRQSDAMDIASWPGVGTAVLSRIDASPVRASSAGSSQGASNAVSASAPAASTAAATSSSDIAAIVVPKPGEEACGDAWSVHQDADFSTLFVVDGLGHGPQAAQAAHEALLQAQRSAAQSPAQIIDDVHRALRPTRGGAIAVARFHRHTALVSFAGLGNIAGAIVGRDGRVRRMVSHNGTAGHNARKIQAFDYPGASGLLIMHSDGIDTRWSLDRYPGVHEFDAFLVAGLLYRDHARGRDDATVVVARI